MSTYTARISWSRKGVPFTDGRYSRAHAWHFDGGLEVPASSSPHVVPLPFSDPGAVDPEEAYVASLSSCHMLWFLHRAARQGLVVESYEDDAIGLMERDEAGKLAITRVTLRPLATFAGPEPVAEQLDALHEEAHESCFIASSVKTEVRCEPRHGYAERAAGATNEHGVME
jgi:organic hydroperoxide reductase OsmC/OhrA